MRRKLYLKKELLKHKLNIKWIQTTLLLRQGVSGLGVVEVIMILLVLVGLVLIFKAQITQIINSLFKSIKTDIKSI